MAEKMINRPRCSVCGAFVAANDPGGREISRFVAQVSDAPLLRKRRQRADLLKLNNQRASDGLPPARVSQNHAPVQ